MIRHLLRRSVAPILALAVIAGVSGCDWDALTPQQQQAITAHFEKKANEERWYAAVAANEAEAEANDGDHFENLPSPGQPGFVSNDSLARLRQCEATGNYGAVSSSGAYRGAYQFSRDTWNGVADRWASRLRGADPAGASPQDQDDMARALFSERGRSPWPHCGQRM